MGIVVVVKRSKDGNIDYSVEIGMPEIKELIGQNGDFEERSPAILYGRGHIV